MSTLMLNSGSAAMMFSRTVTSGSSLFTSSTTLDTAWGSTGSLTSLNMLPKFPLEMAACILMVLISPMSADVSFPAAAVFSSEDGCLFQDVQNVDGQVTGKFEFLADGAETLAHLVVNLGPEGAFELQLPAGHPDHVAG